MENISTKSTGELIRRFSPYFKKYINILIFDLFCALLTTTCDLILPLIIRYITDMATNSLSTLTVKLIFTIGLIYIILRLIDAAANYFMVSVGHVMGAKIETDMRSDLFSKLQKLDFTYYDNNKIGQIMARMTSDLFDVTEFAHHCPEEFFIAFVKILVSFIILCNFNIWLTIIIFSLLPLMFFCSMYFNKKMRITFKKSRNQIGNINSQLEDSLLGIRIVKSFANEDIEKQKFSQDNSLLLKIKKEIYRCLAGFHSVVRLFDGLMYISVVVAGSLFLIYGKITAGDLVAYLLYVTTLLASIRRIIEFAEQFQRGITGIDRFFEVMDENFQIKNVKNAKNLKNVKGNIKFENVSFKYGEDGENILSNINLTVKPGENVALVGPSGGGKTTLCNLIPRFYEVTSGKILIDDNDIRTVTLESLRKNIGVVQQDIYLFSGSIEHNILYGKPNASHEEVIKAAKSAGAYEFIMNLPDKFNTYVGERGIKLSGGQKQRIGIARIFLKDPPILILDEATSALDNESEQLVLKSLQKLASGRTTFTIAHRLTTVRNAKTILVLDDKGIVESGSHEELIKNKGLYSKLADVAFSSTENL